MTIATFTLKTATTNATAPFSLGHTFKKGDVPSSALLVGDTSLQVVPKNTWNDGSLKFAVISGRTSLTADVAKTVTLSIGTPIDEAVITLFELKYTGITASINAGTFGTVSWADTDWDSPWQTWVTGPYMSSWVYRKPVGTDPHLVAFLEVRLFKGGQVEVLPWIENGYLNVAGPTNKPETYTFTMGGTQRFTGVIDLKHHTRTVLLNGTMLSYWLGTDPGVTPRHDVAYMQASELVPSYATSIPASNLTHATSYAPFQINNFVYNGDYGTDQMTNPGYQPSIGLLPSHDVAYLVCTDQHELLYGSVVRNGFSVDRYPIHYRDETTNRVPRISAYPELVLSPGSGIASTGGSNTKTPAPTGGVVAPWDIAHCPAAGVMPYLVTGHWYHMEVMQFAVTANYFNIFAYNSRAKSYGRFIPAYGATQTRTAAWGFRSLAHALALTPDDDTILKAEFAFAAERLINYYHATFVAQPNNPFGIIEPGENVTSGGLSSVAIWQHDFFTAAYGYALAMEVQVDPAVLTKLGEFFQWTARSVVMRLGPQDKFWYVNGAPYTARFTSAYLPDYQGGTGPWLPDDAAVYAATYATPPAWMSSTEGVIGAEYTHDAWAKSQWGNLHPALAYAVRHGVPGAKEGQDRLLAATNYYRLQDGFALRPVWDVTPASVGQVVGAAVTTGRITRCSTTSLIPGMTVCGNRGLGVLGAAVATAGTHGAGIMANDVEMPADAGKAFMARVTQWPASGSLAVYEDGSFIYTPAGQGAQSFKYQLYVDGIATGSPQTVSLVSGSAAVLPGAPSVSLAATPGTVTATITAPASNGGASITGYTVLLSNGLTASGAGTSYTFTVANGTTVTATARAINSVGTGPVSATSNSVTPAAAPGTTTVPGAPTVGIATAGDATMSVSFTAPSSNGGSAILNYKATASTGEVVIGQASPLVFTNVSNGVARTIVVSASNALGEGPSSAPSNSVTPTLAAELPGAPIIGIAEAGNESMIIAFAPPTWDGGSPILYYEATTSTGETAIGTESPITVIGLVNGVTRTATVVAFNAAGPSAPSGQSNPVTPIGMASAPVIVAAIADDGLIAVTFEPPASDGGSPITAYMATVSSGEVAYGTTSPIVINGVANGKPQTVTLRAINAFGQGEESAPSNKATPHEAIAMTPIASIVGRVLIYAPTANTITITTAIREAAIELCNDTRLWRYEQAVVYDGSDFVELAGPNQSQVLEVQHARFDGLTIEPRTMRWMDGFREGWRDGLLTGTPDVYTQVELDRVVLCPVRPGVARFSLVVTPSQDATDLPSFITDKYRELIAHGALGRVLMIPNQPYSDPSKGALALEEFARQLNALKNRAVYGQQRARVRSKPSYF